MKCADWIAEHLVSARRMCRQHTASTAIIRVMSRQTGRQSSHRKRVDCIHRIDQPAGMRPTGGMSLATKRYVLGGYTAWVALLIVVYYEAERPSGRSLGPDRPERGDRHPGGPATQSPRPQGALVPARRRARFLRGRPAQLPDRGADRRGPALSLVRGRALPVGVSAGRGRAADLHLLALPGRRPAQPHRRADAHRRPRPAVVDVPNPAICAQSRAFRAAEGRRDRLPARRRAHARPAGEAARAGLRAVQVRPAPHPWRRRVPGVRRGLRDHAVARDVPQRHVRRPRLGAVLLRLGRRGAAPEHDPAHRAGAEAAGRGLAGQAGPAHARLAHRPCRAAYRPAAGPRRPT